MLQLKQQSIRYPRAMKFLEILKAIFWDNFLAPIMGFFVFIGGLLVIGAALGAASFVVWMFLWAVSDILNILAGG